MLTKRDILLANLGLDVSMPAEYIDARSSPSGQNIYVNRNAIHKRIGTTQLGASLGEEVMAYRELLQQSTRYIVRVGLSNIELYNKSSDVWSNICTYTIGDSNKFLDFKITSGGSEKTATIAKASYAMGADQTTAGSLCKAIYDAIAAADATGTYTVSYTAGKVVIARVAATGEIFSILWATGSNTANSVGATLGYTVAADDTGALSYTADDTPVYLTATTNAPVSMATPILLGSRLLVITNLADTIKKYNPVVSTLVTDLGGAPPKAKFVQDFGGYLVLANVANYPMRVQWSDTDDIETWSGGNSGAQELLEDGNDITGLSVFGNYLCVHKETAIYLGYLVSTSNVFAFERRGTHIGTICNATIQNISTGEQIFLAHDGIRVFNGHLAQLIESPIQDELRESMNPQYFNKCWSVVVPELDEYWVGVPIGSQTGPDTVYKFNYVTRQCYKDLRTGTTAVGKYEAVADLVWNSDSDTWDSATDRWDDTSLLGRHQTIILGDNAGISVKRDTGASNDNGVAINAYRDTKDFEGENKGAMVRWLGMQMWAKGNSVTLYYSTDAGGNWTKVDDYTLASDYPADDTPVWAYFDVVSTRIRFRFENKTASETFALKDFQVECKQREFRR